MESFVIGELLVVLALASPFGATTTVGHHPLVGLTTSLLAKRRSVVAVAALQSWGRIDHELGGPVMIIREAAPPP